MFNVYFIYIFKILTLIYIIKMAKAKYVLEVLEFIAEKEGADGWLVQGCKIKHVGYMKGKFKTTKYAVSYYRLRLTFGIITNIFHICVL
jgi:coenzyme F420-reducing hydrogenase delta subunit